MDENMALFNRYLHLIRPAFWLCLSLFAILNVYQLVCRSDKALQEPMDFRIYYLGTKLYTQGQNFYSDSLLRSEWQYIVSAEHITSYSQPGYPNSVFVYLPGLVAMYYPYVLMPWETAKTVALAVAVVMLLLSARMLRLMQTRRIIGVTGLLILLLAFKGTRFALLTGQPMLLCLGMCAMALYLFRKNYKIAAGILIGLASFKFSFVIPLAFWFLLQKEWRVVLSSLFSGLLINLFVWAQYGFSITLLYDFTAHVNTLWKFAHSYGETNSLNTNTTELSTCLKYFADINLGFLRTASLLCYIIGYALATWLLLKKKVPAYFILVLLYLTDFCFSHHLLYDCIVLILIVLCLKYISIRYRIILALLLIPILLPLNQWFQAMGWYGLMTITPVFVFMLYLYWLWLTASINRLPHHAPLS